MTDRDTGLRRTSMITGALVVASLAGTLAVGVAAHTADSAETGDTGEQATTTTDDGTQNTTGSPTLSTGEDDGAQATSGGS